MGGVGRSGEDQKFAPGGGLGQAGIWGKKGENVRQTEFRGEGPGQFRRAVGPDGVVMVELVLAAKARGFDELQALGQLALSLECGQVFHALGVSHGATTWQLFAPRVHFLQNI